MDFRNYDAAIGRFNVIDPMASFAPNHTPYRFGFNNPVFFGDPSGMYEINTIDGQTNVILNSEEMKVYNSLLKNGNLEGLKGDDLVNAIVEGLESSGFSNNYTLDEVTVTGSKQNDFNQFAFSNKCITGCHQTPGGFSYNNTPLLQKSSQTFYWHSGGKGGGFGNSFMKPGDRVEMLDLLEWLSISRSYTPSSMHTEGLVDIFSLLQMWDKTGNTKNMIDAVVPIQAKDTVLKLRVREANSSYRGSYYIKGEGYHSPQTFYRSKDTLIHTTSDKIEKVQKLIDSIDNKRL